MTSQGPHGTSPVWHPFTQHGLGVPAIQIASASGAWLTTATGERLHELRGHADRTPTGFSMMLYNCVFSADGQMLGVLDLKRGEHGRN